MVTQKGVHEEQDPTLHQCLDSLKKAILHEPRTRPVIITAKTVQADSDALTIAKSLERLEFKSVEVMFNAGGWTLYPPVPHDAELTSCLPLTDGYRQVSGLRKSWTIAFVGLCAFSLPLPYRRNRYRCSNCQYIWKRDS
ncbi:MAG: hypothetical protein ACREVE_12405 [Gammaproteobacteria bacterium]